MTTDELFMQRCIQLARQGAAGAAPNPMVGAAIVCDGRIIGEGFHRRCGGPHAEVNAIGSVREKDLLSKSTLYVSLEPCAHYGKTPPCADLIIRSGIPRVIIGCTDTFSKVNGLGIERLRNAGVEVVVGVLEAECRTLNERFFTFHEQERPWVTLKWAQSLDGFIDRERSTKEAPTVFSTPLTQTLSHRLRAHRQAIMVGTRTALMDNPTLTTRLWDGPSPLRVTFDCHDKLPHTLHLKDGTPPTVIYNHSRLKEVLKDLHAQGIQSLLVEGGARLLQNFIDEGLWDEARIETAPIILYKGVKAPVLPVMKPQKEQRFGQQQIRYFYAPKTLSRYHIR